MRADKFRRKDTHTGEWEYYTLDELMAGEDAIDRSGRFKGRGQSIGVEDKHDKEIYAGDILKVRYEDLLGVERKVVGIVEMAGLMVVLDFPNNGVTVALSDFHTEDAGDLEVIGNVLDNPALVEVE